MLQGLRRIIFRQSTVLNLLALSGTKENVYVIIT